MSMEQGQDPGDESYGFQCDCGAELQDVLAPTCWNCNADLDAELEMSLRRTRAELEQLRKGE